MSRQQGTRVDQSALKVNQAFIITLVILAFILDAFGLVALVAIILLLGTAVPSLSLFKRIYRHLLQPVGLVKPNLIEDNPEPHRFSQGLGGLFLTAAVISLGAGLPLLGWGLTWLVVALAALNLFVGFCTGCFVYYQLNKLGVPGFSAAPIR